jgi:hypothetical protein
VFVPPLLTAEGGYMTYTVGPGGDLIVRWRLHELVHPFVSTFFEYVFGETIALPGPDRTLVPIQVPDLYLVRTQLGGILITAIGDLQLYSFLEVGHGEGVRKFYEEVRWGVGTRGVLIR